ncbi:MAG: NUDIX hydrolase [Alphaproteobacteria bacterium]|nr:NUDIX hydrolase [Alphaproteobacteria bacterium]
MKKVEISARRLLYDGHYRLRSATYRFEKLNGEMSPELTHLVWDTGTAVAAIVLNRSSGRVVLTRQFRIATHDQGPGWMVEIAAGGVHAGETPEHAVRREILEELGFTVDELHRIGVYYVAPGSCSEQMHFFLAEVSDQGRQTRGGGTDEGEDIEVFEVAPWDLWKDMEEGRLRDSKTVLAALWLKERLRGRQC